MSILVLNAGSSSLKYKLFDTATLQSRIEGAIENIEEGGYTAAFEEMEAALAGQGVTSLNQLDAIGHRVVHGGERFVDAAVYPPSPMFSITPSIRDWRVAVSKSLYLSEELPALRTKILMIPPPFPKLGSL